jgi:hypothetical protein
MLLESPGRVRFNKVYFTIFREILIFEYTLLLEIQTNGKNWVWMNVFTLGPSIFAHLPNS